jgi:hypothetical protein
MSPFSLVEGYLLFGETLCSHPVPKLQETCANDIGSIETSVILTKLHGVPFLNVTLIFGAIRNLNLKLRILCALICMIITC